MFNLFKADPRKKLEKQHRALLEQARDLQRNGDIKEYAVVMASAEEVAARIDALDAH
ncbi:MAG: DUF6435 family protein [Acidobacteriota bacterium]